VVEQNRADDYAGHRVTEMGTTMDTMDTKA
jgi:hypothetical protein